MKARIALVLNAMGEWCAFGTNVDDDTEKVWCAHETLQEITDVSSASVHAYWVEVDLPSAMPAIKGTILSTSFAIRK